jgi:hypothetical protein
MVLAHCAAAELMHTRLITHTAHDHSYHEQEKRKAMLAKHKMDTRQAQYDKLVVLALYSDPTSIRMGDCVYRIPPHQQLHLTREMRSLVFNGIPGDPHSLVSIPRH